MQIDNIQKLIVMAGLSYVLGRTVEKIAEAGTASGAESLKHIKEAHSLLSMEMQRLEELEATKPAPIRRRRRTKAEIEAEAAARAKYVPEDDDEDVDDDEDEDEVPAPAPVKKLKKSKSIIPRKRVLGG